MNAKQIRSKGGFILFDADSASEIADEHFDPAWWKSRGGIVGEARGRGAVLFVRQGSETWALRHFRRGGWMARLSPDAYIWLGLKRTRMWREWQMLAELLRRGLPVAHPIAARAERHGLVYRGDLITRLIEGADTLASILVRRALPEAEWRVVGTLLARFQNHGVRHDDINVRNVLRDQSGGYSLIDFDKARFTKPGAWSLDNLARFRRSLEKLRRLDPRTHFIPSDWQALRDGYDATSSGPGTQETAGTALGITRS